MSSYAVIDLEMCKVPKGTSHLYQAGAEIIQIGAVLVDEDFNIVDQFSTYVKPQFGWIDSYIKGLTGISNELVKEAPIINDAITEFLEWLPDEDVTIVSWSMTDKNQLKKELALKEQLFDRLDLLFETWVDCQELFGKKVDAYRRYSLKEALIATDIWGDGREHDGLSDAMNTAILFSKMQSGQLEFNKYYEVAKCDGKEETLSVSLGELFKNLGTQLVSA